MLSLRIYLLVNSVMICFSYVTYWYAHADLLNARYVGSKPTEFVRLLFCKFFKCFLLTLM